MSEGRNLTEMRRRISLWIGGHEIQADRFVSDSHTEDQSLWQKIFRHIAFIYLPI